MSETIIIGKAEYPVEEKEMFQRELKFYPENPRVYSAINVSQGIPAQEEIERVLKGMEHVKQLRLSIESNGGLIDPVIIRDNDNVVLEEIADLLHIEYSLQKTQLSGVKVDAKHYQQIFPNRLYLLCSVNITL